MFNLSLPFFRAFGISVRIHILFIALMVYRLWPFAHGWSEAAAWWGVVFGSVLLHEFGHSLACRAVGGKADRILIWPFGGLAECAPPLHPLASLWTTLWGPAVNLILMAVSACVLMWVQMDANQAMPISLHPLHMEWSGSAADYVSPLAYWMVTVYQINYGLFLFNMLVPCYPMDCGRVVQEILWLFIGYARSLFVAAHLGLLLAIAMGICGAMKLFGFGQLNLYMAIFLGMQSWSARQSIMALRSQYNSWSEIPDPKHEAVVTGWLGQIIGKPKDEFETKANPNQDEINRILTKVSMYGLASLTDDERAMLHS